MTFTRTAKQQAAYEADKRGPNAQKLATLLTACEEVSDLLAQYGCAPALSGASPFSYRAATMLRDAINEARKS